MFLSSESWEDVNLFEWICLHCGKKGDQKTTALCARIRKEISHSLCSRKMVLWTWQWLENSHEAWIGCRHRRTIKYGRSWFTYSSSVIRIILIGFTFSWASLWLQSLHCPAGLSSCDCSRFVQPRCCHWLASLFLSVPETTGPPPEPSTNQSL